MKRLFTCLYTVLFLLLAANAHAAKPDKVAICHYGEEVITDENGLEVINPETGEVETRIVTSILNLPENPAQKHIDKHGDVPLQTGDAEADAQALADCLALAGDDGSSEPSSNSSSEKKTINAPANTIHPGILDGRGTGTNANPNDDVGGKHGIGNNPGQSGTNPNDDGTRGFANQLGTVHGGIGTVNQNVD